MEADSGSLPEGSVACSRTVKYWPSLTKGAHKVCTGCRTRRLREGEPAVGTDRRDDGEQQSREEGQAVTASFRPSSTVEWGRSCGAVRSVSLCAQRWITGTRRLTGRG